MNIVVTGAAGFIGSHLCEALISRGHSILGLDNFDKFYDKRIKEANLAALRNLDKFTFGEVDLLDAPALVSIVGSFIPDVIVHLAAKAGVRPSILEPDAYIRTNIEGTLNVFEAARSAGCRRMVLASSSSVYGAAQKVPFSETDFVDNPISPYAASKKSCELLAYAWSHLWGLRTAVLRFFTVYGPRQRPDLAIASFAEKILAGKPIPVFGDGSTERDYTYIDDTVEGVCAAVDWTGREQEADAQPAGAVAQSRPVCEVFNIGESQTVKLDDLVSKLETALGKKAIIDRRPMQPGDVPRTWADISKSRRVLGYEPKVGIDEGLRRYVDWLRGASRGQG